ncbi:MAG: hypothetical protein K9H84_00325 [Bacteroidales bacterium]|nr:hypothetical protein [Bacteroidales bacterium]
MKNFASFVFIISIFLALLTTSAKAQQADWTLYKEVNGIQIFQKSTECHDVTNGLHQEIILLKFVNTTSRDMEMSWTLEAWYDGKCVTCNDQNNPEYQFSQQVKGGESVSGTCNIEEGRTLRIFKGFLDKKNTSSLTKFELKNIQTDPK